MECSSLTVSGLRFPGSALKKGSSFLFLKMAIEKTPIFTEAITNLQSVKKLGINLGKVLNRVV